MRDESVPVPVEVCSTKATFLVLQTKLNTKYFGTQKNGSLCETSLLTNIFKEATVLSRKTLEIHDRVANCLCFNGCKSTDRIEECASEDVEEMLKHLETLKKLLKQIEAIELSVPDMKTHVPSKPLNPLSKSFVPSAKVYEQIEKYATNIGGNSLTSSCRMPLEAHAPVTNIESGTEQKVPTSESMFYLSEEREETMVTGYCFNKKIRYLWTETNVVKTSKLSFVSNQNNIDYQDSKTVSNRQFIQPFDYTNIWSPTEQEKKLLCKNNPTDICGFPSFTYFILKDINEKPIESINSSRGGKTVSGYHYEENMKSDLNTNEDSALLLMGFQEDHDNSEDRVKSNGFSDKEGSLYAQKFSLKSDSEKDASVLRKNEQHQTNDTFMLLDEKNGSQRNVLKHLEENDPNLEKFNLGQLPSNFSVCRRPCSNWCSAKQTKNILETGHEKIGNTLISREKNQSVRSCYSNNFDSTSKIKNANCQQKTETSILAAAFVKQTSTIFDTEQWNTWKLAEFRHRRDSGDSGYSSVGQSEHDTKIQQSHMTIDIFGNNDDFSNSRFENDYWTPLPDCKPKLPQSSCKRDSYFQIGHWDPTNSNRLKVRRGGNRTQKAEGSKDGVQIAPKFQRNLRSNKKQTWMMDLAVGK